MKNKELQEQRVRNYFLQATKDLLRAEGLKSLNVRRIADRAGYSYTSLYHYFKDINDLVFLCVNDFYLECKQYTEEQTKRQEQGVKRLRAAVRAYADFFIQYPGIFQLFFQEYWGSYKDKKNVAHTIAFSLDGVCKADWDYCTSKGLIKVEDAESIKSQLRYATLGLLLLYLNQRASFSYTEFVHQLNSQLDLALKGGPAAAAAGPTTIVSSKVVSLSVFQAHL